METLELKLASYQTENLNLKKKMDVYLANEGVSNVIMLENANLQKELASKSFTL